MVMFDENSESQYWVLIIATVIVAALIIWGITAILGALL